MGNASVRVMGILNITEDSFSDGGKYNTLDKALRHADAMVAEGADVIDVGGQSTRPGFRDITESEEIARVLPVIEAIKERFDIPLSLDTYKAKVLKCGLDAGIDMINDVRGLQSGKEYTELVRTCELPYIMMHNRTAQADLSTMDDFLAEANSDIDRALSEGISKNRIIYDPGIGFGKDNRASLMILANLDRLSELHLPILLAASKKSVMQYAAGFQPKDRAEATLAVTAAACYAGISMVRVHDVAANVRLIKMMTALMERRES